MKNVPFALLTVLGAFFIFPVFAHAQVIFENTDDDTNFTIIDGATGGSTVSVYQTLTAQETGTIDNVRFYASRNTSGSTKTFSAEVRDNTGVFVCRLFTTTEGDPEFDSINIGAGNQGLIEWGNITPTFFPCTGVTVNQGTSYRIYWNYNVSGASVDGEMYTKGTTPNSFFFQATDGALPPVPDGQTQTRVVSITAPVNYSTTTSPVEVAIWYYIEPGETDPVTGYGLTFNKFAIAGLSGGYLQEYFDLPATTTGYHYATTSIDMSTLPNGTWRIDARLNTYDSTVATPNIYWFDRDVSSYFGLNNHDNYQRTEFGPPTISYASTSCAISFAGTFNLNDCVGYLFTPTQNVGLTYQGISTDFQQKFPFSYFYSIANTWQNLNAGASGQSPTYTYDFADLGIGSTTPMGNLLPNITVFSASTTEEYFPTGTFDLLKGLAQIAIILTFFGYMFFEIRNLIRT